jgi:hypothetical protein
MIRVRLRLLLSLAPLLAVVACDGGQVVVFAVPPPGSVVSGAGAGSGGMPTAAGTAGSVGGEPNAAGRGSMAMGGAGGSGGDASCSSSDDCGSAWFCEKQNCSDPTGICSPLPVSDDPHLSPVCGCDHRTYFNDVLRKQRRISATTTDTECGRDVRTCCVNDDCLPGGSCSHQVSQFSDCAKQSNCDPQSLGQCWVMPNDCANTSDRPHWLPCPPPGASPGSPPPCITTCQAVQSGFGYFAAPNNACH